MISRVLVQENGFKEYMYVMICEDVGRVRSCKLATMQGYDKELSRLPLPSSTEDRPISLVNGTE